MKERENLKLFKKRKEPPLLSIENNGDYINLRTTDNVSLLQNLLIYLKQQFGADYVIASWISPPFGIVKGYGTYTKEEAQYLSELSKKERWGFPKFGSVYDKGRLEEKINKLIGEHHDLLVYQS